MLLADFIDICELSLVIWVSDFGARAPYRLPTDEDLNRKILRVVGANQGALYIVLRRS